MTLLLEKVFVEVEKLSETEQNALARWLLDELSSERRWDKAFAESEEDLEKLADEALAEQKKQRTHPLDPGRL